MNQPNNTTSNTLQAKKLPKDYVGEAERVIKTLSERSISTTKLRNLFGLFTDIYNKLQFQDADKLNSKQLDSIQTARIRLVYEMGREIETKVFCKSTSIMDYLLSIGDNAKEFTRFYHYMEALVAYARYYGVSAN